MAQWYELAIPAAATLLGGVTGAWFQSRTTERQMRLQAKEAGANRDATADREERERSFTERTTERERSFTERTNERDRFFTEQKQAYVALGEAGYALPPIANELFEAVSRKRQTEMDRAQAEKDKTKVDDAVRQGAAPEKARDKAVDEFNRLADQLEQEATQLNVTSAEYDEAWERFRKALVAVQVVGTQRAAKLASEMADQLHDLTSVRWLPSGAISDEVHTRLAEDPQGYPSRLQAFSRVDRLRDRFLDQARRDLEPRPESTRVPDAKGEPEPET